MAVPRGVVCKMKSRGLLPELLLPLLFNLELTIAKSAIMPRQRVQNWFSTYGWTNTWHQLWGNSTGCPSSELQIVHWTHTGQCLMCSSDMVLAVDVTRWGPVCDTLTPLNTLSRVIAPRSASVCSITLVFSPRTIFHRHSTVSLTRNVLRNIKKHVIFIVLSSTHCNNYIRQAIELSVLLLLIWRLTPWGTP